jgi:hypothetical protein
LSFLVGVVGIGTAFDTLDHPKHRELHRKGIKHKHYDNNLSHKPGEHGHEHWKTRRDGRKYRR